MMGTKNMNEVESGGILKVVSLLGANLLMASPHHSQGPLTVPSSILIII